MKRSWSRWCLVPLLSAVLACNNEAPEVTSQGAPLVGADGAVTVDQPNTVLNSYAVLAANAAAGATTISVTNAADLNSNSFGALAPGDLLLLIQMQGATIDTTNTASYGNIISLNNAGRYELVQVSAINGNNLTIDSGCGGLRNSYTASGRVQVIRVPELSALTITGAGSITAPAWDGARGGIVAVQVQNQAVIDGSINVSGRGFRGGAVDNQSQGSNQDVAGFRSGNAANGGEKGEGLAGDAATYDNLNGRFGRGAPANGGGGGNSHNGGGGGGANGNNGNTYNGQGVMLDTVVGAAAWALDPGFVLNGNARTNSSGGGRGGYSFSNSNQNALTVAPGDNSWGGNSRRERGGLGGRPLNNDPATRLFMGGGGGAGDGNNNAAGAGGAGGGLVLLFADQVSGAGSILANGAAGASTANGTSGNDAPGGGGAGGTIIIGARSLSGIGANANGGVGGNQNITLNNEAEGPGGGGGGGVIAVSGGTITTSVNGASNGTTNSTALTEFPVNGATFGATGQVLTGAAFDPNTIPACIPADLSISVSDGLAQANQGSVITYTITVTNNGPNAVSGASVVDNFPAGLINVSWTCTASAGSSCAIPSGTGDLSDILSLAAGGTATITVTATIDPAATGTISNTATVAAPPGITDPDPTDNSATDTTIILPADNNDAPINVVPGAQTINEDTTLLFIAGTAILITDADAGNGAVQVALTANNGAVTLSGTAGLTFTVGDGTNDPAMTFTGTLAAINLALTGMSFTPDANFTGAASLTVTSNDQGNSGAGGAQSDSDTININVSAQNDAPVNNVPGTQTVNEDATLAFINANAISITDVDSGNGLLSVTLSAANGAMTLSGTAGLTFTVGDGTSDATMIFTGTLASINAALAGMTFTPNANFSGAASITMITSDQGNSGAGGILVDSDTVLITVVPQNDPPTANDQTVNVNEDGSLTILLTGIDPEGDTLTFSAATQPANGTLVVNANGTATYTPDPNFNGSDSFTFQASDGNGGTDTGSVVVVVTAINDAPVANDDSVSTLTNTASNFNVTANDVDVDGNPLSVIAVTQPANGTVTINPDGTVRYTPNAGFTGTDSFTYTVSDGNGGIDSATVSVNVNNVDSDNDGLTDLQETQIGTNPNDADSDNDGLEDGVEVNGQNPTNPLDPDSDGDGLNDGIEDVDQDGVFDSGETNPSDPDTDNGGVFDGVEVLQNGTDPLDPTDDNPIGDTDNDGLADDIENQIGTNPNDADSDNDGLIDGIEVNGQNPTDPLDPDSDNDGLEDGEEDLDRDGGLDPNESNPNDSDTDDGGVPDGVEVNQNGTDPLDAADDDPNGGDADQDGLTDDTEEALGTNPNDADSDNDGIEDGDEVLGQNPTDPLDPDTDNDGLEDGEEDLDQDGTLDPNESDPNDPDTDDDGLTDGTEVLGQNPTDPLDPDSDNDSIEDGVEDANQNGQQNGQETDPNDPDSDNGGIGDGLEILNGTDPLDPNDDFDFIDTDQDGLSDIAENQIGTDPLDPDTDDDGLEDGEEIQIGTDPLNDDTDEDFITDGTEVNGQNPTDPADADSDNDGLTDGLEDKNHDGDIDALETNPNDPDSDDDGLIDGPEVTGENPTNPLDPDSDDDGLDDGVEDENLNGALDNGETNPNDEDTDDGGVNDGIEVNQDGTDPLDPADDQLPNDDPDGDGLTNNEEAVLGTDPNDADSDDDGLEDGTEVNGDNETDPLDADSDDDDLLDGEEDANQDGVFDANETNPNDEDTDDGGVDDGTEVNQNGTDPLDPSDDIVVDPGFLLVGGGGCTVQTSNGSGAWWLLFIGLGVLLIRRRKPSL